MNDLPRREQNRIAKQKRILEAALQVFSNYGYHGASMDAVAKNAGLTKPTIYQYFSNKAELFATMMQSRRDDMLVAFDTPDASRMVAQLHEFAWKYTDTVMHPNFLSLARLIIGEAQRFPEIGKSYQASGPDRVLDGMMSFLIAQRAFENLQFEDPELAAQDLWGLLLSAPRTRALYQPDALPTKQELNRYVYNGLRVFLRAYSTNLADDVQSLHALENAR